MPFPGSSWILPEMQWKFSPTFPADCLKSFKATSKLVYVWICLERLEIQSFNLQPKYQEPIDCLLQIRFGNQGILTLMFEKYL